MDTSKQDQLENFYLNQPEPNKSCFLTLRDVILSMDQNVTNELKYGMPCFSYKGKMFCYLWKDKKTDQPYILFVEGKHLNNPLLKTGSRARMKVLNINPLEDLPIDLIKLLLAEAIELYKNGTIKIK